MFLDAAGQNFAHKLLEYRQETDYKVADSPEERMAVYRLRYDAYMREETIDRNSARVFHDAYDDFNNCWIFSISIDGRMISSIRLHVISQEFRKGPALDVFPDIVGPMIDEGKVLIDPTRFVADEQAMIRYPELPYLTLRAACMASEFFDADYCLATVRREHAAFYRRVFRSTFMCDPRPYPGLKKPICLLRADVSNIRDKLMTRYPIFESSFTERRMIFEQRDMLQAMNGSSIVGPVLGDNLARSFMDGTLSHKLNS
ncbi:MAG: hypothetical protein JKY83_12530 [Rhizobiaceae bacterium]|nr:hypothetical protein [Rhizobiaceae bacterium]